LPPCPLSHTSTTSGLDTVLRVDMRSVVPTLSSHTCGNQKYTRQCPPSRHAECSSHLVLSRACIPKSTLDIIDCVDMRSAVPTLSLSRVSNKSTVDTVYFVDMQSVVPTLYCLTRVYQKYTRHCPPCRHAECSSRLVLCHACLPKVHSTLSTVSTCGVCSRLVLSHPCLPKVHSTLSTQSTCRV